MYWSSRRGFLPLVLVLLVSVLVVGLTILPRAAIAVQSDPVTAAWERARGRLVLFR